MSRPAEMVPSPARPDASPSQTVSGIVGDAILGSADVTRTRERRRITRLRRLVGVSALALGWIVIRKINGHGIFPSVHVPHWFGGFLPLMLIVLMLGAV